MASDREIFAGLDEMSELALALERKRRAQAAMLALMGLDNPLREGGERKKRGQGEHRLDAHHAVVGLTHDNRLARKEPVELV